MEGQVEMGNQIQIDLKGVDLKPIDEIMQGRQGVFVTFFPHIDTPVSKFQLEDMRNSYASIVQNNYDLVAVTLEDIPQAIKELELPFRVIKDKNERLAEVFRVLKKGISGKICLRRTFFLTPEFKAQITINDLNEAIQLITKSTNRWNALA
ncbi:MAG: hypothetical protein D6732_20790 [Methanobacteriota archaeon]|nr:MAG: hypothetical protein D6732_20790 [Euryarchaeota archaeon]